MSHKKTNIENYLYFADSEDLAGSNDDDKIVMWPTSDILALLPGSATTIRTNFLRADGTQAADYAQVTITEAAPSMDEWIAALKVVTACYQNRKHKAFVVVADSANEVSCHDGHIKSAAGTVTIATTAL